jgi:hypothetical protein
MRFAAAWTGDGFIDWRGIHFNGQHQVHPKLAGERHVENPVGPGWADPRTGSFTDPRFLGRDKRPYGPLPRKWARFRAPTPSATRRCFVHRRRGGSPRVPGAEADPARPGAVVFTRTLEVGESPRDLLARVAPEGVAAAVVGDGGCHSWQRDGFTVLKIPAAATPTRVKLLMAKGGPPGRSRRSPGRPPRRGR